MSGILVSSSYSAVAMLVSISEGFARDGLLGAILLRACCDILAVVMMSNWNRVCRGQ